MVGCTKLSNWAAISAYSASVKPPAGLALSATMTARVDTTFTVPVRIVGAEQGAWAVLYVTTSPTAGTAASDPLPATDRESCDDRAARAEAMRRANKFRSSRR